MSSNNITKEEFLENFKKFNIIAKKALKRFEDIDYKTTNTIDYKTTNTIDSTNTTNTTNTIDSTNKVAIPEINPNI